MAPKPWEEAKSLQRPLADGALQIIAPARRKTQDLGSRRTRQAILKKSARALAILPLKIAIRTSSGVTKAARR